MYRVLLAILFILGVGCTDIEATQADLGTTSPDLSMTSPDLSMTSPDLSMTSPDLSMPAGPLGWRWANPLPQGNPLRGIWGKDANNVWAVGFNGTIV